MQEITVNVKQDPGKVSWNYEEIKRRLREDLQIYKTTVYTDDTIRSAKADIAYLRKLASQINDRKKDIKAVYLEPYDRFEAQVKEILALIDEPIQAINEQLADYERRRKEKVRAEILAYWQMKSADLPEEIREKAYQKIYDTRWENATASKKTWHDGIDNGVMQIQKDLETITSFQSEFEPEMIQTYYLGFSLADAMRKMRDLEDQKRRILERERLRKEAEEKRKAEEAARQEAIRRAEEEKKIPYEKPAVIAEPRPEKAQEGTDPVQMEESTQSKGKSFPEAGNAQGQANPGLETIVLQITGTPAQIRKIRGYISYLKAEQKEVTNAFNG